VRKLYITIGGILGCWVLCCGWWFSSSDSVSLSESTANWLGEKNVDVVEVARSGVVLGPRFRLD